MLRLLLVCAAVGLATVAASAADHRVDRAVRTFRDIGYNQYKLNTYCQMSQVVDSQGDRDDDAADDALQPYIDRLGPDFEEAWDLSQDTDENSYDGRRLNAALEALDNRCPDVDDGDDDSNDSDDNDDAADNADDANDAADTINDILHGDH
jgi:hypothetical protein